MDRIELSIVLPALNEEKTICACIEKAFTALRRMGIEDRSEIIVADNGSTDATRARAETRGVRVIAVPGRGYGNAVNAGCEAARGTLIVFADADDSYDCGEIGPFVERLREGYDVVIGNRFKGVIEKGAMPFLHRYVGTPLLSATLGILFRARIGDCNCGMRGITKDALERLSFHAEGMEYISGMLAQALLLKMRIVELPCNLYRDKRGRPSHLRTFRDGWRNIRLLLTLRLRPRPAQNYG